MPLYIFILIPFIGFLFSLACPVSKESLISKVAFTAVGLQFVYFVFFILYWLLEGFQFIDSFGITLFHTTGYTFYIEFNFDKISAVYLFVGTTITFLVTIYSRYYLHREGGYKRYFNTMLFFFLGYNTIILSGNLETLFVGWEILGISSFLLIAFYRHRYLPVKNAVKVFSIYRLGDVGIILVMWASHHLWHSNVSFSTMNMYDLVDFKLHTYSGIGIFISLMIVISAAAKSAQLPFSSWLPRAMEGPTPSSAIFYGSLSVHIGVFLLLRTFPFWEHQFSVRILIGSIGFLSSIIATGIARVQSSVKSQIAYASIAQIGLIFIEVACGLQNIALAHFAFNAFLRTYQILVSPSIVSYRIREQFYNFIPRRLTFEDSFPRKIENTFYILCLNEWNLDYLMYRFLWSPLKKGGSYMKIFSLRWVIILLAFVYIIGLYGVYHQEIIPNDIQIYLPVGFAFIGLAFVLRSFSERKNVFLSWTLVIANHFWVALSISLNEYFKLDQVHIYLSGIILSGALGYICLLRLKFKEGIIDLNQFHGYSYNHSLLGLIFLLACLGVTGFPITPTFIGEDLIFSHIKDNQVILAFLISLSFMIDGLAIIRIYARVFLGPHSKASLEMAYRSS